MIRLAAALSAALLGMTLFIGEVAATPPTPAGGQVWAQNQRVNFRWKEGAEPPTWLRPAINAAVTDSNQSRDAKAAILAQSDSGTSWIGYTPDIPTNYSIGYTIGYQPN